jgi:hypothetical protein
MGRAVNLAGLGLRFAVDRVAMGGVRILELPIPSQIKRRLIADPLGCPQGKIRSCFLWLFYNRCRLIMTPFRLTQKKCPMTFCTYNAEFFCKPFDQPLVWLL